MITTKIVALGPIGATFSSDAYMELADIYGAPQMTDHWVEPLAVEKNDDVLPTMIDISGGTGNFIKQKTLGVLAMETLAGGHITEPIESFSKLLNLDRKPRLHVLCAIKKSLHFVLMAQKGISLEHIQGITAHPKALQACERHVAKLGVHSAKATSNGEAARSVAEMSGYQKYAALGPVSAAEKYGLTILNPAFEDERAVTTFFLLSTRREKPLVLEKNRVLLALRLIDQPGSLVRVLSRLSWLNMIHIHSVYAGGGAYDFIVELECRKDQAEECSRTIEQIRGYVAKMFAFGPFGVKET